mgnify:CR=1 FL=1
MDDVTLDETAPEGQPVLEAIADASSTETATPDAGSASAPAEQPVFQTRTYAGKYQSPDELERAYLDSQREASRMAGELSAMKRTADPATSAQPKWKELESERNKWAAHMRNGALDESARSQADDQVRLYDREIAYERAKHDLSQQSTRTHAEQQLEQDSTKLFQQYQTELDNPSSPLYQASLSRYQQLLQAGYPDNMNTKALSVAYAAALTGAGTTKAIAGDRSAMLKTLNKQVKQAVVTGAGGPTPVKSGAVTSEQIANMTAKEFAKYERQLLGV